MNRKQKRSKKQIPSQKPIRVLIGMPSTGMVPMYFATSLARITFFCGHDSRNIEPVMFDSRVNPLDRARYEMVDQARHYQCEYLFFYDTDMVLPGNIIHSLMEHKKDIVGCNYPRRNKDLAPTAKSLDGKKLDPIDQGLIEVLGIPTGCLLIRTKVFEDLEFPWFRFELNDKGIMLSEDYYFCNLARAGGHKIFCDTSLSLQLIHIGEEKFQFENGTGKIVEIK